ncbi:MAG: phasin family protein [Rhodoferax sp.]|nr:phasin family protein [Rhodoferax sp.]
MGQDANHASKETPMQNTVEQLTATANENLDLLHELTTRAHEDATKLVELNLATTKNLMSVSFDYAKAMAGAKDPQSWTSLQTVWAKPLGEIATGYAQEFQKIMTSAESAPRLCSA